MAPIHKDATVDILLIIFDKIIVGRLIIIVIWGEILFFIYLWSLFDHPIRPIFFIAGIEWLGWFFFWLVFFVKLDGKVRAKYKKEDNNSDD